MIRHMTNSEHVQNMTSVEFLLSLQETICCWRGIKIYCSLLPITDYPVFMLLICVRFKGRAQAFVCVGCLTV